MSDSGAAAPPAGVTPIYITEQTLERWGMKTGPDIVDVVEYKYLNKAVIEKEIVEMGFMCDFQPLRKQVAAFKGDQLLVIYDEESVYGQNYWWASSMEVFEREHARIEAEKAQASGAADGAKPGAAGDDGKADEDEYAELDLPDFEVQPMIARPWDGQQSEAQIRSEAVVPRRKKLGFTIARARSGFGARIEFNDTEPGDKIPEYPRQKVPNYDTSRKVLEMGFQAAAATTDSSSQTTWYRSVNKGCQVEPQQMPKARRNQIIHSEHLLQFLSRAVPMCEEFLEHNETVDIFRDEFSMFEEEEASSGAKNANTLKSLHTFTSLKFSKGRTISGINWHPTQIGAVVCVCTNSLSFKQWIAVSGMVLNSAVLIWNFKDPLQPEYVLSAPGNLQCVSVNPHNPMLIAGGLESGRVVFWNLEDVAKSRAAAAAAASSGVVAQVQDDSNNNNNSNKQQQQQQQKQQEDEKENKDGSNNSDGMRVQVTSHDGTTDSDHFRPGDNNSNNNNNNNTGGGDGSLDSKNSASNRVRIEDGLPIVSPRVLSNVDLGHSRAVTDIKWLPRHLFVKNQKGDVVYINDGSDNSAGDDKKKHSNSNDNDAPRESQERELPPFSTQFMSLSSDGHVVFWDTVGILEEDSKDDDKAAQKIARLPSAGRTRMQTGFQPKLPGQSDGIETVLNPTFTLPLITQGGGANSAPISAVKMTDSVDTRLVCVTDDGKVGFVDWNAQPTDEQPKPTSVKRLSPAHYRAAKAVERSPHFPDVYLSVGDWTFIVWKEGVEQPVFVSPFASSYMTIARWSPSRPGVIITGREDGVIDVWDLLDQCHKESLSYNAAEVAITSMEFWQSTTNSTQFLAVGDKDGNVQVLEIPRSLRRKVPREEKLMRTFFEREIHRTEYVRSHALGGSADMDSFESKRNNDSAAAATASGAASGDRSTASAQSNRQDQHGHHQHGKASKEPQLDDEDLRAEEEYKKLLQKYKSELLS